MSLDSVRYDNRRTGTTHCIGRHGWPTEKQADRYAHQLAKTIALEYEAEAADRARAETPTVHPEDQTPTVHQSIPACNPRQSSRRSKARQSIAT